MDGERRTIPTSSINFDNTDTYPPDNLYNEKKQCDQPGIETINRPS